MLAESGDRGGERALQVWANGAQLAADGREMLSCIPGASPQPYAWSEDAVACVGTLLRELHAAAATFIPPPGTTHRSHLQRAIS